MFRVFPESSAEVARASNTLILSMLPKTPVHGLNENAAKRLGCPMQSMNRPPPSQVIWAIPCEQLKLARVGAAWASGAPLVIRNPKNMKRVVRRIIDVCMAFLAG